MSNNINKNFGQFQKPFKVEVKYVKHAKILEKYLLLNCQEIAMDINRLDDYMVLRQFLEDVISARHEVENQ